MANGAFLELAVATMREGVMVAAYFLLLTTFF
jgi:hypothetical protein